MSAILSADDLNDFISPGVACIKPLTQNDSANDQSTSLNENGEVEIQIDDQGNPLEISQIDGKQSALTPAQISLSDCLACLGCITSAEEVLVAQHSHQELVNALENRNGRVFVASVSQQARASLATAYNLTMDDVDKLLINLFVHQMGFAYVVGTSLGRKLSLINEARGLIEKKETGDIKDGPVLSSICPGWVLYAEKTHPYVLPRVSTVKSPQQITGCLLKTLSAAALEVPKSRVYHVSIMPCFDKKLESARPEIHDDSEKAVPDVDCVLTAKELITLIEEQAPKYQLLPEDNTSSILQINTPMNEIYKRCAPPNWPFIEYSWSNDPGSASGGYAYNYLQIFQENLLVKGGYDASKFAIETINGKNSDIYELRLMYDGQKLASSAVVNGFRNIQNLVRKLKPAPAGKTAVKSNPLAARRRARMAGRDKTDAAEETADASKVDYVEIMACPGGCINGGGQISAPATVPEKEWISEALAKYNQVPMFDLSLHPNDIESFIRWSNLFEQDYHISNDRLFKTHFNAVEKPTDPAAILVGSKW
ncbi:Cytosolic Fe-S cluster assembly factor NAR1 [Candida viswanathii]|uniref:Cytosolic Fe-S cluster assembly factor NAR1 n=1 Tax=Candida viswanathii TaxID=5486 RepID=A0A367Y5A1_9ASCO|nr:Cytosolic Fe-S cluster assembly factor NAR1 [Candida viswanathii]